jgi:hypothetical protein
VPLKRVSTSRRNKRHAVPLSRKVLTKLLKRKQRLWSPFLKTRDGEVYSEYCKVRNQIRRLTRSSTKQYEQGISDEAKTNPKKICRYVQTKTKTSVSVPDLYTHDEKDTIGSDKENADVLAD